MVHAEVQTTTQDPLWLLFRARVVTYPPHPMHEVLCTLRADGRRRQLQLQATR